MDNIGNVLKNGWWFLELFFVIFIVDSKRKQALLESNLPAIGLMLILKKG
jgi:hypothetical protein